MERELLAAAQRGDEVAFVDLIRPPSGRLFATAHRILRDIDRAEDALRRTERGCAADNDASTVSSRCSPAKTPTRPRRQLAYRQGVRVRWIVLDVAGATVNVEVVAPAGQVDAAMREEQPLVDSLDFPPAS